MPRQVEYALRACYLLTCRTAMEFAENRLSHRRLMTPAIPFISQEFFYGSVSGGGDGALAGSGQCAALA